VAVENDYNLLVFTLNDLAEDLLSIRAEVEKQLMEEKREGLEPNETRWVNLVAARTLPLSGMIQSLAKMAQMVLNSQPGEAVFTAQPPPPPDAPP